MSKFRDIISSDVPVLINFCAHNHQADADDKNISLLKDVANGVSGKAKVVKIDINKNQALVDALRIKTSPTYFVYKNTEMLWRQSGTIDAKTLIDVLEQFV